MFASFPQPIVILSTQSPIAFDETPPSALNAFETSFLFTTCLISRFQNLSCFDFVAVVKQLPRKRAADRVFDLH